MKINKLNYEAFALEYLEGTLSVKEQEAMDQFLLKHPDIKAELEDMKSFSVLTPEPIVFNNKKQLLKAPARNRLVWFNPLRSSVAASVLLAITILFFSKTTSIDLTIATTTPDEVIDKRPTESILPKETKKVPEVLTMDHQVTSEATTQAVVAMNETPIKQVNKEAVKAIIKKKEGIINFTIPDESQVVIASVPPSTVAYEKEKAREAVSPNSTTLVPQAAKETIQVAALSTRDIVLLDVPIENNTIIDISQAVNTAIAKSPERRTLKSFIGKLPGNGVKVSIIPSFFTD